MGLSRVLVYCADYKCARHIVVDAAQWPHDMRLSDLEPSGGWGTFHRAALAKNSGPISQ